MAVIFTIIIAAVNFRVVWNYKIFIMDCEWKKKKNLDQI
jgi:hypothetical protein